VVIHILADSVINKIAAGEVVDRPFSIVKELVENSIDAGATSIDVLINKGGKSLILVTDNGKGMSYDDAILAFERHATSKIVSDKDILNIVTRGFRGEALSSIAAISRLRLITKTIDDELGTEILINGGVINSVNRIIAPVGTTIELNNIFYNVPVRKKFLKSDIYEANKIKYLLQKIFLAEPTIEVSFSHDSKNIFSYSLNDSILQRAQSICKGNTVIVNYQNDNIKISGLIGHPAMVKCDFDTLLLLVNKRVILDRVILKAIRDGFQSTVKYYEQPLGYISIDLPTEEVDINVHPQKSEVRFLNHNQVSENVRKAVLIAVESTAKPFEPKIYFKSPIVASANNISIVPKLESSNIANTTLLDNLQNYECKDFPKQEVKLELRDNLNNYLDNLFLFSDLKYIGTVFSCFLVCEMSDRLILVDMHAAHERVNYYKVLRSFTNSSLSVQHLVIFFEILLANELCDVLMANKNILLNIGFAIDKNHNGIIVKSIPRFGSNFKGFTQEELTAILTEVAEEFSGESFKEYSDFFSLPSRLREKYEAVAAMVACKSSIKTGDVITVDEVVELFNQLDNTPLKGACPHGRPISFSLTKTQLENWFRR
jgi:DNA mismatch repair protein MutL